MQQDTKMHSLLDSRNQIVKPKMETFYYLGIFYNMNQPEPDRSIATHYNMPVLCIAGFLRDQIMSCHLKNHITHVAAMIFCKLITHVKTKNSKI